MRFFAYPDSFDPADLFLQPDVGDVVTWIVGDLHGEPSSQAENI